MVLTSIDLKHNSVLTSINHKKWYLPVLTLKQYGINQYQPYMLLTSINRKAFGINLYE